MKSTYRSYRELPGVRIPKPILNQTGLRDEVEIQVEDDAVVIRPATPPRAGWEEAFRQMASRGEDGLLDDVEPTLSAWDDQTWQW